MTDLIERLRDRDAVVTRGLFHAFPAMREAADELERLSSAVRGMREALEKAGAQFRFYENEHQAKADAVYAVSGPRRDEYEKRRAKAKTNKHFADMCAAALSVEEGKEQARGQGRSAPISTDTKDTTK